MPISPHFNNYSKSLSGEQLLLEDLLNEQIYISGCDAYYIARESADSVDFILGEDPTSKFEKCYQVAVLIEAVDDWTAGSDLFKKFGLTINKQNSVIITRREFRRFIPESLAYRPRDGDLLFIPVLQKLFEIKFVEDEAEFYAHGKVLPYYYRMQIESFKYSHEPIETGIEEVDEIERIYAYDIDLYVTGGNGVHFIIDEPFYQDSNVEGSATASAKVANWDIANNIVKVYGIKGEFVPGSNVFGAQSGAAYVINDFDELEDAEEYRLYHNDEYQVVSNTIVSQAETNPFGSV